MGVFIPGNNPHHNLTHEGDTGGLTSRSDYSKSLPSNQKPNTHGQIAGSSNPLTPGQEAGYVATIAAAKPINPTQADYQRSVVGEPSISSVPPSASGGTNPSAAFAAAYGSKSQNMANRRRR